MTDMNIDSLLDSSIDDLADLPEFAVYPAGVHRVIISFAEKVVNNHPSVEMGMKCVETIELSDPTKDEPLVPGTESSVLYMLDNEFSQGKFKKIMQVLAASCGTASIRDTMEAAQGMEVEAVCKPRQNKEKTQSYTEVIKLMV